MPNLSQPLERTQEVLVSWHLVDAHDDALGRVVSVQEKMFDVMSTMTAEGWRCNIASMPDGSAKIELNADTPTRQVVAVTGDRLVIDFDGLKKISAEQAAEFFTEAGA